MTVTESSPLEPLVRALPAGTVLTDRDLIASYRQDGARDPGAGWPLAVVRATSTADVQAVLRWASAGRVPVVPRGAGTGLSGGATAVDGGLVLTLERMREVTIDRAARVAVAQAGALNGAVKRAAAEHGLWYPPDPSSFESCSIGGNVATNAGGLCCVKYGVTSDYVLGLEVVTADGAALALGGPRLKDAAGLGLTRLFVGSGGILGVITEVTLRLLPPPPPAATLVAAFGSATAAARAVVAILGQLRPAMLELMDHTSVNAVEDYTRMGLDRGARGLLFARSDAPGAAAAAELAAMEAACRGEGATEVYVTDDPAQGEALAAARRASLPALERLGDVMLEDVGVTPDRLPELMDGIEAIAAATGTTIATVAHAGDGNAHPLVVFDRSDPDAASRARLAFGQVMELALRLDGTISGEHGVGRLKKDWLPAYLGPDVTAVTRRIKDALDPLGILNPGAIL